MLAALPVLAAQAQVSADDLVGKITTAASLLAIIGLVLVLPLYLAQRREVQRLLLWQSLEPHRGEGDRDGATAATALAPPSASPRPAAATGRLTPAERVTADRPALERITAERAALSSPSFRRRFLAGGPRHPLVLSLAAVLLAAAAVAAYALIGSGGDGGEGGSAGGLDRGQVPVMVLNGSSETALAGKMAELLRAEGFEQIETGTTTSANQTVVLFNGQRRREARAVARELNVRVVQPFDRIARAAAPDASVVVVVGEDHAGDRR